MLTDIDHFVIFVSDQRAALDFYVGTLGFELQHCTTGMLYGGYDLRLGLKGSPTSLVLALRSSGAQLSANRIMLSCDDLCKTYEELIAKGVIFRMHLNGGLEFVSFVDPDGNEFYLSHNNKSWIDERALERLMQGIPDFPLSL
jgi:catechol 2,3-dioxygenase-like lactoylglutathione lyase family enzyme